MAHPHARADDARASARVAAPIAILLVLLACLGAGGLVYFQSQEASLRAQAMAELGSVCTLQTRYLSNWRREREADAVLLRHEQALVDALSRPGPRAPATTEVLRSLVASGYSLAAVLDRGGKVVAADGGSFDFADLEHDLLQRVLETGRLGWNDFSTDRAGVHLELGVPLSSRDEPGAIRGMLYLRIDPVSWVFPLFSGWPVTRASAESQLVRREGDEVVFVSGLREGHVAPLAHRRSLSDPELPAGRAVLGSDGGTGTDYRGERVLFAARPVPDSGWFVVAKIDEAEVLRPARTRAYAASGGALALILAAAVASVLWWHMREAQLESERTASELKAAAALRESEERFRRAVLQAPFPIMIHAEDGTVVALSRAWVATSGYGVSEIPTVADWTERAYGSRQDQVKAYIDGLYQLDDVVAEGEHEILTRQGGRRIWDFSIAPLGSMSDGKRLVISMAKDVTERRRAEAELAAEKDRLAVTLRSIGDAVIAADTGARITLMNRVAETLTGWASAEALGRPLAEVFSVVDERTREPASDPAVKVLAAERAVGPSDHRILVARDGRERPIATCGAPIHDAAGRTIGVVLVFRDVTEENRRDAALARAERLESLAVLAGGLAHDFNNILTGVLANIALAEEDPSGDAVPALLAEARRAAQRAGALTRQLLTFAKGGAPLRRISDVREVVRETALFCAHGWSGRCDLELEDGLWSAHVDAGQLAQVVQNIVINAIEAMPDGGTVRVCAGNVHLEPGGHLPLAPGPYVRISVTDEGPGVPKSVQDRIFEPFFTTKARGSGLGLAVSHSIIAKHDGHIALGAGDGSGAVFDVYLPATPDASPQVMVPVTSGTIQGRVLVMDDEENIRRTAARILGSAGCEVVTAADGDEAIVRYQEAIEAGAPFDTVILDLTVPGGLGGVRALAALKQIDPGIRAIVSSGYSHDPVMSSYAAHGFAAVLAKPYAAAELREVVSSVLAALRAN